MKVYLFRDDGDDDHLQRGHHWGQDKSLVVPVAHDAHSQSPERSPKNLQDGEEKEEELNDPEDTADETEWHLQREQQKKD